MLAWASARTQVPLINWAGEREGLCVKRALVSLTDVITALYGRVHRPMHLPARWDVADAVRAALQRRLVEYLTDGQGLLYMDDLNDILLRAASRDLARRHHVYSILHARATAAPVEPGRVLKIFEHHYVGPEQFWCGKLIESFFDPGGRYYHFCTVVDRRDALTLVVPMTTKPAGGAIVPLLLKYPSYAVCGVASLVSDEVLRLGRPSDRSIEMSDVNRIALTIREKQIVNIEPSTKCLDSTWLAKYARRELSPDDHRIVEVHFLRCYTCLEVTRKMMEDKTDSSNLDDTTTGDDDLSAELRQALSEYWTRNANAESGRPLVEVRATEGVRQGQLWSTRSVDLLVPGFEGEHLTAEDFDSIPHLVLIVNEPKGLETNLQTVRVVPLTHRLDQLAPDDFILGADEGPLGYPIGVEFFNEQEMFVQNLNTCLGTVESPERIEQARQPASARETGSAKYSTSSRESFHDREWYRTAYLRVPVDMLRTGQAVERMSKAISRLTQLSRETIIRLCQAAAVYVERIIAAQMNAEALAFDSEDRTIAPPLSLRYEQEDLTIDLEERASGEVVVTISLPALIPALTPGRLFLVSEDGNTSEYKAAIFAGRDDKWAVGSVVVASSVSELVERVGSRFVPVYISGDTSEET